MLVASDIGCLDDGEIVYMKCVMVCFVMLHFKNLWLYDS
jgi:hypothetical protein